jgi:hypothetical protein
VILRKLLWDKLLDGDDKGAAEAMLRAELPPAGQARSLV